MLQAELSVVALLMPPDDLDVALMLVRLSLKRSLTVRFALMAFIPRPVLANRFSSAQPVLGPILLHSCASLFSRSTGSRSDTVAVLCSPCFGLRWPVFCALWPVAVPHSQLAVFECPMILI